MKRKNAVFIGDIFRVHTMLKGGKFGGSTFKLARLLTNTVKCLGYDTRLIQDRTSADVYKLYNTVFGDQENVHTWAYRSQILSPRVNAFYAELLEDVSLLIGFEVPESLYRFCTDNGIRVFDFSFHFVRFEADYSLMVRTNAPAADELLQMIPHRVNPLDALARIHATRDDTGLYDCDDVHLFMIQTRFDRSKFDGQGGILDDLNLIRSADMPITHYKMHPMEHRPEIELHFHQAGAKPFPVLADIYAYLGRFGHKTKVYTVSSGLAAEADIIGAAGVHYLTGFPWSIAGHEKYSAANTTIEGRFYPVNNYIFAPDFFRALITDTPCLPPEYQAGRFNLKEFWNVKWS